MIIPRAMFRFSSIAAGMMFARIGQQESSTECEIESVKDRGIQFANSLPQLPDHCKRIYLLRHGQTEWNLKGLMQGGTYDIPLNENGLEQAALASEELSGISLDIIVSSHLKRAHQTANVIHQKTQSQAKRLVFSQFGEMKFGNFEGNPIRGPDATEETKSRFELLNDQMIRNLDQPWPGDGGESTRDVEVRSRKGIDEILSRYKEEKHIAIVAHGRTNKILLASLLLNDASQFRTIKQGNTCINVIDFNERENRWSTVLVNYIDHTESKGAGSGGTM